ncbi:MAG: hypothetical protein ABTQ34_08555 [Bdellovibrionales bacterium]
MGSKGQSSFPVFLGLVLVVVFLGAVISLLMNAKDSARGENLEHRVVMPTNVDKDSDPDRILIETTAVGTLWVKSGRGGAGANEAIIQPLRDAQASSEPVAVGFSAMTREISKVYAPVLDTIRDVAPGEGSGKNLFVQGVKMATPVILSASHPRFAELRDRLEAAKRDGDSVALAVPAGGQEVVDVVVMP